MDSITVMQAASAIVLIGAVMAVLVKATKPIKDNEKLMDEHERKLNNDHERLDRMESMTNMQSLALIQMMNHMIDGNHVDKLKEARDDLQKSVILK